ncbi:MAG: efflux RND transporter periplasmic adaptor subunit [Bacteroidota bacterium]|nr:efflux RND transporter periplasmic adaptor subunit [Bacteroidota bacterium]
MVKNTVHILIILVAAHLMTGCNDKKGPNDKAQFVISDSLMKTLKIDSVGKCPIVNSLTLTGKVGFDEDKVARIYPMVSGIISGVRLQIGDYVQKGQVMGVIRSSEMAGYSSDLVSAKANLLIARKNMDASDEMYKSGLMSQKDYITAQEMYKQAEAQYARSSEVLQINGGNSNGEYVIRAPISGFIVEKQVNNDMAIRADNSTSLYTISNLKDVWVEANVYESNISQVHKGDEADITTLSYPGRVFKGKVDQVLNVLDPTNKVMKIKIILPNLDYALKPEMFASVSVVNDRRSDALCVPASSLIFDNSEYFVLVYHSPSDVKTVPVKIISSNAGISYVTGDIQQGDKVIASNGILIYAALNN